GQGHPLGPGQRGAQLQPGQGRPGAQGAEGRSRPDHQARAAASHGPPLQHLQADQPHHGGGRRPARNRGRPAPSGIRPAARAPGARPGSRGQARVAGATRGIHRPARRRARARGRDPRPKTHQNPPRESRRRRDGHPQEGQSKEGEEEQVMGHKVHPNGFRLGVYRNWEAKWFAPDKEFKGLLLEDVRLRRMLVNRLKNAGIARIETERSSSALTITLHTAKPGIVIGKGGTSVDQLRDELEKMTRKRVRVTIQEIKKPELSAQLVAESVAAQLEKRIAFRRAVKQSLMKTMRAGAQGVKIRVKGRLGGSEMARIEWNREGRAPLHTLPADIEFGETEAT